VLPVRVAFDPALPVFAADALSCGEQKFVADQPFPWRELGMSEFELRAFWTSGLVYFKPLEEKPKQVEPSTVESPKRKRTAQQPTG
jgi:hypothetical protein